MHIEKAKAGQVVGLIMHDERTCENHTNEKIDPERSHLNYNLVPGQALENYNKRMEQVFMRKNKNTNALAMLTTTLPKDFPSERSEEFFRACHKFYCEKFGEENIISDIVHRDETTPHMHTKLIPVYYNEKKQRDTVSYDKVVNRNVYRNIHRELQDYLEKQMGIPVPILNGATAGGNKTIQELKAADLQKENERLEHELQHKNAAILSKTQEYREVAAQLHDTEDKLDSALEELHELKQYSTKLENKVNEIMKQHSIVEAKLEETKDAVKEIQNFENTAAANWIVEFLELVHRSLQRLRREGREAEGLFIPTKHLESLERALQPFIWIKDKVLELTSSFSKLQDLMQQAETLQKSKPAPKQKTKQKDHER